MATSTCNDESGFRARDTPHGFVKRAILRQYLSGYFSRHVANFINHGKRYAEYWSICYIDAFAWKGEYENSDGDFPDDPNENVKKGSPILALSEGLKVLKRQWKRIKDQNLPYCHPQFKAIHFIFNDINEDNIKNLKRLAEIESKKFGLPVEKNDNFFLYELQESDMWYFQVSFVVGDFKDLAVPLDADNIFSMIDPCGITQIPLFSVEKFIGKDKEAFINLMVMTINRVANNSRARSCIYKVFGNSDEATKVISAAVDDKKDLKEKYESFVVSYENKLRNVCEEHGTKAIHFLFAKGTRKENNADMFYMVFVNNRVPWSGKKSLQDMKFAMQRFANSEDNRNRFTDYYCWNGIRVPLGRKVTYEEEADTIWEHFQGQTVSLFDVQDWIVSHETPYPFHSRALTVLEKRCCLTVDSGDESRIQGNFLATPSQFCKWKTKLVKTFK